MGVPADGGGVMPDSVVLVVLVIALAGWLWALAKETRRG